MLTTQPSDLALLEAAADLDRLASVVMEAVNTSVARCHFAAGEAANACAEIAETDDERAEQSHLEACAYLCAVHEAEKAGLIPKMTLWGRIDLARKIASRANEID